MSQRPDDGRRCPAMKRLRKLTLFMCLAGLLAEPRPASIAAQPADVAQTNRAARDKGLAWLTKNQAKDGSWGKQYTIAVTSFACLSYLAASDEPFTGEHAKALVKGLEFLLANQKDGMVASQGHSWIHGQGFATLAMAEAYGRSLLC